MTIDKEQLISLLEEKTGLEREEVEGQLSTLISRIQAASEEGKAFEIKGFGTFSLEGDELQFMPASKLETEINNKYAGMKPIELIGAFKEPEDEKEIPDINLHKNRGEDQAAKQWELDTEAIGSGEEHEPETEKVEKEIQEEPAEESSEEETVQADTETEETVEETVPAMSGVEESEVPDSDTHDKQAEEESDDLLGTILVAAVVVLAIGVGGWLIYDLGYSSSQYSESQISTRQSTPVSNPDNGNQAAKAQENKATSESSEPEQKTQVTNGDESDESDDSEQERYGLFGKPKTSIDNGYTIVVHSLRSKQKAERNRKGLQDDGYRALVSRAEINGTTYYRVGIGQFETVQAAQNVLDNIPDEYRDNNFIKRIQ